MHTKPNLKLASSSMRYQIFSNFMRFSDNLAGSLSATSVLDPPLEKYAVTCQDAPCSHRYSSQYSRKTEKKEKYKGKVHVIQAS